MAIQFPYAMDEYNKVQYLQRKGKGGFWGQGPKPSDWGTLTQEEWSFLNEYAKTGQGKVKRETAEVVDKYAAQYGGGKTVAQQKTEQQSQEQVQLKQNLDTYLPGMYDAIGNVKAVRTGFYEVYNEYANVLGKPAGSGALDPTVLQTMSQSGGVNYINEAANNFRTFRSAERKEKRMTNIKNIAGVAAFGLGAGLVSPVAGAAAASKISPDIAKSPLLALTTAASSLPKTTTPEVTPETIGMTKATPETPDSLWNRGISAGEGIAGAAKGDAGFWEQLWKFSKNEGLPALMAIGVKAITAPMERKITKQAGDLREIERADLLRGRQQTEESYAAKLKKLQRLQQRQLGAQQTEFRERGIAQAGIAQPLKSELEFEQEEERQATVERPLRQYQQDWEATRARLAKQRDIETESQRLSKYKGFLESGVGALTPIL